MEYGETSGKFLTSFARLEENDVSMVNSKGISSIVQIVDPFIKMSNTFVAIALYNWMFYNII